MDFKPDFSGATSDAHLVGLWLSGRPESTQRVYKSAVDLFLAALAPKTLRETTVADVVAWSETLEGADTTRARLISTVKSLLSYAHRTGYTVFNVGRALRCPKLPSRLHERIVDEDTVRAVLASAASPRDKALTRLLYASGCRIAEAMALRFLDLGTGRVTLCGKGSKTRTVMVPEAVVAELRALRTREDGPRSPVFKSCRGKPLGERDAREIVYQVAERAGVKLSPHAFRHAHASHALDHGCPIHVLSQSLGHANVSTTSGYLHARPHQGASQYLAF